MRTLVLTVMMMAVAVATGASFLVRAQGAASATLAASCEPRDRPSGVDVLLTCTFTARNTGPSTIENATLGFQPSQGLDIPDRYYFWSWRLDSGPPQPAHPGQLSYEMGDIPRGGTRLLEIEVIVRASRRSGADAVLSTGGGSDELARTKLAGEVSTAVTTDVGLGLDLVAEPDRLGHYRAIITVSPISETPLDSLTVGLDQDWIADGGSALATGDPSYVRVSYPEGLRLNAGTVNTFEFGLVAPQACTGGVVAVVAQLTQSDGSALRPAVLGFVEYDDACYGDAAPTRLPAGGDGPAAAPASAIDLLAALGVLGAALIAAGCIVRRLARR